MKQIKFLDIPENFVLKRKFTYAKQVAKHYYIKKPDIYELVLYGNKPHLRFCSFEQLLDNVCDIAEIPIEAYTDSINDTLAKYRKQIKARQQQERIKQST